MHTHPKDFITFSKVPIRKSLNDPEICFNVIGNSL